MPKFNGYILQRGNSPIDGERFVVILTMKSANRKTGNMGQVWILTEDVSPVEAIQTGQDRTICGSCPHRKNPETGVRTCYVNPGQAPLSVWKTYHAGKYGKLSDLNPQDLEGLKIRWGAYGDPAIVSPSLFALINDHAAGHTAYSHQWREPWAQWAKGAMMASCDSLSDYLEATAHGWRTFAVAPKGQTLPGKLCPATVQGSQATCQTCQLCNGSRASVYVEAHGPSAAKVGAV